MAQTTDKKKPDAARTGAEDARSRWILRGLMTMIAAVPIGLGALAIATEVHTGSTRRQGIVTLEGEAAVEMGVILVVLGLLPLAVWARTATQAKVWLALCLVAFGVLLTRTLMR